MDVEKVVAESMPQKEGVIRKAQGVDNVPASVGYRRNDPLKEPGLPMGLMYLGPENT
jgi:hypothetical protein